MTGRLLAAAVSAPVVDEDPADVVLDPEGAAVVLVVVGELDVLEQAASAIDPAATTSPAIHRLPVIPHSDLRRCAVTIGRATFPGYLLSETLPLPPSADGYRETLPWVCTASQWARPTTGATRWSAPVEPSKGAPPKAKMPPSEATSQ